MTWLTPFTFLSVLTTSPADDGAGTPSGPAAVVRNLADLPNTTVRYYDVEGTDVASINRSIARQRPIVDGKPQPASASWTVKTTFQRRSEDGQCKVVGASATFVATAELPRLVGEHRLKRPLLVQWRKYAEGLEANELPTLVFVYSQLDAVRDAVLASSCADASAAGASAVAKLKAATAAFELARHKQMRRTERMFAEAGWFDTAPEKPVCKAMMATGSRLSTLRVCMMRREWEMLQQSGEAATREMQQKRRLNSAL